MAMKKYIGMLFLLAFLLQETSLYAKVVDEVSLQAKGGVFVPFSNEVRKIYNGVISDIEWELGTRFFKNWQSWANVSYIFFEDGRSLGLHESANLKLLPLSLGIKYFQPINPSTDFYFGAGAVCSFLWVDNHSRYIPNHMRKIAPGAIVKTGFIYRWDEHFFVEGFLDYLYQRFEFSKSHHVGSHDLNLSGIKFGFALGVFY